MPRGVFEDGRKATATTLPTAGEGRAKEQKRVGCLCHKLKLSHPRRGGRDGEGKILLPPLSSAAEQYNCCLLACFLEEGEKRTRSTSPWSSAAAAIPFYYVVLVVVVVCPRGDRWRETWCRRRRRPPPAKQPWRKRGLEGRTKSLVVTRVFSPLSKGLLSLQSPCPGWWNGRRRGKEAKAHLSRGECYIVHFGQGKEKERESWAREKVERGKSFPLFTVVLSRSLSPTNCHGQATTQPPVHS